MNKVVLDSNVLIAAINLGDSHTEECQKLINKLSDDGYEIIAPVTGLWEITAYHSHPEKAKVHLQNKEIAFKMTHYDVTSDLFFNTYTAAMAAVKGADRVFVSLAKSHRCPLVTNDKQILANASILGISAISVTDFLALTPQ